MTNTKRLSTKRFFQLTVLEDTLSAKAIQYKSFSLKMAKIKNIKMALHYNSKINRCQIIALKIRNQIRKGNDGIF